MTDSTKYWPITHEHRQNAVDALNRIIAGDDAPLILRAIRLVLAMDELNDRWEKADDALLRELSAVTEGYR